MTLELLGLNSILIKGRDGDGDGSELSSFLIEF
jgi:hypothetical protein